MKMYYSGEGLCVCCGRRYMENSVPFIQFYCKPKTPFKSVYADSRSERLLRGEGDNPRR